LPFLPVAVFSVALFTVAVFTVYRLSTGPKKSFSSNSCSLANYHSCYSFRL